MNFYNFIFWKLIKKIPSPARRRILKNHEIHKLRKLNQKNLGILINRTKGHLRTKLILVMNPPTFQEINLINSSFHTQRTGANYPPTLRSRVSQITSKRIKASSRTSPHHSVSSQRDSRTARQTVPGLRAIFASCPHSRKTTPKFESSEFFFTAETRHEIAWLPPLELLNLYR